MSFGSSTTSSPLFLLSDESRFSRRSSNPGNEALLSFRPLLSLPLTLALQLDQRSRLRRDLQIHFGQTAASRSVPFRQHLPLRRRLFSSLRQSDSSLSLSSASLSSSVPLLSCAAFRSVASLSRRLSSPLWHPDPPLPLLSTSPSSSTTGSISFISFLDFGESSTRSRSTRSIYCCFLHHHLPANPLSLQQLSRSD